MMRIFILQNNHKLTYNMFKTFVSEVSDDFKPPFLSYVDLQMYYDKVINLGKIIVCQEEKELAGLLFFYCNDMNTKQAYASFLAVSPKYRKRGIATFLMQEAISYSKNVGMNSIRLRTNNKIALKTYQQLGYKIIEDIFEEEVGLTRYYLLKQL